MNITDEQKRLCIQLYKEGAVSIKEILKQTGIGSEQSVYRIVDEAGLPRLRRNSAHKASISFDEETWAIIERHQPRKLSQFVCDSIKKVHGRKK